VLLGDGLGWSLIEQNFDGKEILLPRKFVVRPVVTPLDLYHSHLVPLGTVLYRHIVLKNYGIADPSIVPSFFTANVNELLEN